MTDLQFKRFDDCADMWTPPPRVQGLCCLARRRSGGALSLSEPLNAIWWQGAQWAVTEYGIECRNGLYALARGDLEDGLDLIVLVNHARR